MTDAALIEHLTAALLAGRSVADAEAVAAAACGGDAERVERLVPEAMRLVSDRAEGTAATAGCDSNAGESGGGQRKPLPFILRWRDAYEAQPATCARCRSRYCAGGMPPLRRYTLDRLSRSAGEDGLARSRWPSTDTLAQRMGASRRVVEDHLRAAERGGWIERNRRSRRAAVDYTLRITTHPTCDASVGTPRNDSPVDTPSSDSRRVGTPRSDPARVDTSGSDSSRYSPAPRVDTPRSTDGCLDDEVVVGENASVRAGEQAHTHEGAAATAAEQAPPAAAAAAGPSPGVSAGDNQSPADGRDGQYQIPRRPDSSGTTLRVDNHPIEPHNPKTNQTDGQDTPLPATAAAATRGSTVDTAALRARAVVERPCSGCHGGLSKGDPDGGLCWSCRRDLKAAALPLRAVR